MGKHGQVDAYRHSLWVLELVGSKCRTHARGDEDAKKHKADEIGINKKRKEILIQYNNIFIKKKYLYIKGYFILIITTIMKKDFEIKNIEKLK